MFRERFVNGDITCVTAHNKYILAGIGFHLFVYQNNVLKGRIKIFNGERLHNITVCKDILILKGCKELFLITIAEECNKIGYHTVGRIRCKDWILDVVYDPNEELCIVGTAHNLIEVWHVPSGKCLKTYSCKEKCILYSCTFVGNRVENLVLLCGTVFSDVVVWAPSKSNEADQEVLHYLRGHGGVIFSIVVDISEKVICSTSDDRSVRVWHVNTDVALCGAKNWENAEILLIHVLYGHTARVWKSLILSSFIISVGEDSKFCVWKEGKLENCLHLHHESGIRGLFWSRKLEAIITGGEDGGINLLPVGMLESEPLTKGIYLSKRCFGLPRKVAFVECGIVCTTDQGSVLFAKSCSGELQLEIIFSHPEFSNYCLLDVSVCSRFFSLASIHGRVIIIETKSKRIVFDENLVADKVFSLHWLEDCVVLCTSYGIVHLLKIEYHPVFELRKWKEFILPNSKERWTTTGLLFGEYLLLGDRMGSLHVYSLASGDGDPHQSFVKLHGYLGLTDIFRERDSILTSGRDGSLRQFRLVDDSFICCARFKLPMEWPWKIVTYEGDRLVLGFSSVNLLVWSLNKREILVRYNCGGGHRSWDFAVFDGHLKLVYIRDKKIHFAVLRFPSSVQIREGFHSKEINCLRIIRANPPIAVTGSEDTTIRISRIIGDDLQQLHVIETHISSVRDLNIHTVSDDEVIFFSGGGRAQISVNQFDLKELRYRELGSFFLSSLEKGLPEPSSRGETRVMCIDSTAASGRILLVAACSDRQIRLFAYEKGLTHLTSIPHTHCVLKVRFLRLDTSLIVISMGTDGLVVFWSITDIQSESAFAGKAHSIRIHQSGINSCDLQEVGNGRYLLATGGDDNLISVLLLDINTESYGTFTVRDQWENSTTHSCQITGIKFLEKRLLTASVDQRLTVWDYNVVGTALSVKFVSQYLSAVGDVQGMEAHPNEDGSILVGLHGKGLEIVEVDSSPS